MSQKEPGIDLERLMPAEKWDWRGIRPQASRYVFAAKFTSDKVCLDIACGAGYGSNYLLRSGARSVLGGDISQEAIKNAKTYYNQGDLHFLRTDAQQLPFKDETFDVVISMETIEHLKDPGQFLSKCYRVLKPGGRLILSTPNKAVYDHRNQNKPTLFNPFYVSPYHVREFDAGELRCLAEEKHFHDMAIYGQDFINKNIAWRLRVLAVYIVRRLILVFPNGQPILSFLNRRVLRRRYLKLEQVSQEELTNIEDDNIAPYPQKGEPTNIILVARK